MGSVGFLVKLSACILIFLILENFCVTCSDEWCYDRPECGPNTWASIGSCGGKRQSPININTKTAIYDSGFGRIHFNNYGNYNVLKKVKNSGSYLEFTCHPIATISFSKHAYFYVLQGGHLHWGTKKSNGAEHTINGERYGMEMHLVHTKQNMSIEEASKESDGIVNLAIFIEKKEGHKDHADWDELVKCAQKVPEKGNSFNVNRNFSMGFLVKDAFIGTYYHYTGSRTSPPCTENVKWIVFPQPVTVSSTMFYQLLDKKYYTSAAEGNKMENNFRPGQPLNGRKVYFHSDYKSLYYSDYKLGYYSDHKSAYYSDHNSVCYSHFKLLFHCLKKYMTRTH